MNFIMRLFAMSSEPQTFRYHWLNLRTNKRGIKTIQCANRRQFHDKLAKWNRLDPNHWKYWEAI